MAANGDLGELELTEGLVAAWGNYDRATNRLTTFLETVAYDTLAFLRDQLSARSGRKPERLVSFVPLRKTKKKSSKGRADVGGSLPVKYEDGLLWLRFAVPSGAQRRFEIGFDIQDDVPRFLSRPRLKLQNDCHRRRLMPGGRGHRRLKKHYKGRPEADLGAWEDFGIDVAFPLSDFIGDADVPGRLSDLIPEARTCIRRERIFDADISAL